MVFRRLSRREISVCRTQRFLQKSSQLTVIQVGTAVILQAPPDPLTVVLPDRITEFQEITPLSFGSVKLHCTSVTGQVVNPGLNNPSAGWNDRFDSTLRAPDSPRKKSPEESLKLCSSSEIRCVCSVFHSLQPPAALPSGRSFNTSAKIDHHVFPGSAHGR